jgi:hypothetical protein
MGCIGCATWPTHRADTMPNNDLRDTAAGRRAGGDACCSARYQARAVGTPYQGPGGTTSVRWADWDTG